MLKRFLPLVVLMVLSVELTAQESVCTREGLVGHWVLEKAVLTESTIEGDVRSSQKVLKLEDFASRFLGADHFLLPSVILSMKLYEDDDDPDAYIQITQGQIISPVVELDHLHLIIYDPLLKGNSLGISYQVKEFSDEILVLSSGEMFYNDKRVPMKAELEVYLRK